MKEKKFTTRLFENNKFVFFISLLLAFIIWLSFSIYGGEEQERTIDVPIQIDSMTVPKQFNLREFGDFSNSTVAVTISGKKAVIGTVTSDDINVIASTLAVNSAGKHSLPLSVRKDSNKEFEIVSTNTLSVEVYFDTYREVNVQVEEEFSAKPTVPDGYEMGTITFTSDKILVYGPATEVSKVDKVIARADISGNLTKTTSFDAVIVAVDEYDNEVQNVNFKNSENFKVTIPVFKRATLPVGVEFANMPDGISEDNLNVSYSRETLDIAAEETTLGSIDYINIGTIDFSHLTNSKSVFKFDVTSLAGMKVKSNVKEITVTVDLSKYYTKTVSVSTKAIENVNSSSGRTVKIKDKVLKINIVGKDENVKKLTASNLSVVLNINDDTKVAANQELAVTVKLKGNNTAWVVGTYTVKADVS